MNRLTIPSLLALAALPVAAQAQTIYVNETFDTDTIGQAPTDSALRRSNLVTVIAAPVSPTPGFQMGPGNVAHFNDNNTGSGGALEYNVGTSALGSLFISFDLFNNAAVASGTAANPLTFSVGNWNESTSAVLTANASRSFAIDFYQTGGTNTVRMRVNSTGTDPVYQGSYDMAQVLSVSIFINDHDTQSLNYLIPGGSTIGTLAANSAAIYFNDSIVASFGMSTSTGTGNTTGNETLGRFGFNSTTTNTPNFLIDNVYASSIAIPEPSAFAALAGLGALGCAATRRRRR